MSGKSALPLLSRPATEEAKSRFAVSTRASNCISSRLCVVVRLATRTRHASARGQKVRMAAGDIGGALIETL